MNRPTLIILCGIGVFLLTLLCLPVEATFHVGLPIHTTHYEFSRPIWNIGPFESIRFSVVGMWWLAIALVTGGLWLVSKRR